MSQPPQQYGDEYSEIVEDEDAGELQPQRPSVLARLMSVFGFGVSPSSPPAGPESGTSIVDKKIQEALAVPTDRRKQYALYSMMMQHPTTSGIVETFAEEATQEDHDKGRMLWPESRNAKVLQAVEECLRAIRAEENAYPIIESFTAYGDHFERLIVREKTGVMGMNRLLQSDCERIEDAHRRIVGFRVAGADFGRTHEKLKDLSFPWDVIHWRMAPRYDPVRITSQDMYGRSIMYAMQRPFRALVLSEDRLLKQRLKRSGGRYFWTIPVPAGTSEGEARRVAEAAKKKLSISEAIDATAGTMSKRGNFISDMEDIYWPVRDGDTAPTVNPMPEVTGDVAMEDILYFEDQIYGVAKTPKAYFGRTTEGALQLDRTKTVSQQDIRMARTARRLRSTYLGGLKTIIDIHLSIVASNPDFGTSVEDALKAYSLRVPRLAALEELDRIEVVKMQIDVAEALAQLGASLRLNPSLWTAHLLVTYLKLPPEEVISLLAQAGEITTNPQDGGDVPGEPSAESQLRGGLHSLNEQEQRWLKALVENPKVKRALYNVGEVCGVMYLPEDSSRIYPVALTDAEAVAAYCRYDGKRTMKIVNTEDKTIWDDEIDVKAAIEENFSIIRGDKDAVAA